MKISRTIFLYIIIFLSSANLYGRYEINMEDSDFKPSATFNINVALLTAYASQLAYSDDVEELRSFLRNHGFLRNDGLHGFSQHSISVGILDTQFFVANKSIEIDGTEKNLILISFRGTAGVNDVLTDINSTAVSYEHGKVHKGFYDSSEAARSMENVIPVLDPIHQRSSSLNSVIRNAKNENTIFLVVGHSLGGAIATLYSTSLLNRGVPKSKILVYTYGAPSVGDMTYVNTYDGNLYLHRVRNQYDPVPFAAYFDTLIDIGDSTVNMGITFSQLGLTAVKNLWNSAWNNYPYKHIGYMRVFDKDGFDITANYGNMNIFSSSGRLAFNFAEHKMDKYVQNLVGYFLETPGDDYIRSWNGNASIIHFNGSSAVSDGSKKFGVNMDITRIHPDGFQTDKKPVVFFQWQVDLDKGKNLEISAPGYNGKATISYGPWNKENKDKRSYFNVSFPFILNPSKDFTHENGNWYVIAVSFYEKVNTVITVKAEAVNKPGSSYTSNTFQEVLVSLSGPRSWTGNGSIISRTVESSSDEDFSINIDWAYVESVTSPASVVFFQWEVDKRDGTKLEISSDDNCVSQARLVYGPWNDRSRDISQVKKLPYKLDPTLNAYPLEVNEDNGPWYVVAVIPGTMSKSRCIIQAKPVN